EHLLGVAAAHDDAAVERAPAHDRVQLRRARVEPIERSALGGGDGLQVPPKQSLLLRLRHQALAPGIVEQRRTIEASMERTHQRRRERGAAGFPGHRGTSPTRRSGAPDPPPIFIGSATTQAPVSGSSSRCATFSRPGTLAAPTSWCTGKLPDSPKSMLAVSTPITDTWRSSTRSTAASRPYDGKCRCVVRPGVSSPK